MAGWPRGFGLHQSLNRISDQELFNNQYFDWGTSQFRPGYHAPPPPPPPPAPVPQHDNFMVHQFPANAGKFQSFSGVGSHSQFPITYNYASHNSASIPMQYSNYQNQMSQSNVVDTNIQQGKEVQQENSGNPVNTNPNHQSDYQNYPVETRFDEANQLSSSKHDMRSSGNNKFINCSNNVSNNVSTDDSGSSDVGGSCSDLTGDEDEEDPPELKIQPRNYQEKLRLELLKRENHIIKFWLSRRSLNPQSKNSFPDVYRLRHIKNLNKKAKSAFELLFAKIPRHLKPEFTKAANTRPDLGYFHVRCSWNSFQHTVHGYGNTVEAAENDAGIKALITVFGEEEYNCVNEMTQDSLFAYEGMDMTRIHSHLSLKQKEPKSFGKGSPTFEYELTSQPTSLKLSSLPGTPEFTVPKFEVNLLSKKLPLYGKEESRTTPASYDNLMLFQSIEKLKTLADLEAMAVPALGSLFVGDLEPSPKYTTFINGTPTNPTFRVECVANRKYFVAEAMTEEAAKNAAAIKALKFIIGNNTFGSLIHENSKRKQKKHKDKDTASAAGNEMSVEDTDTYDRRK